MPRRRDPPDLHGLTVAEITESAQREAYRLASQQLLALSHARLEPLDVIARLLEWLIARS